MHFKQMVQIRIKFWRYEWNSFYHGFVCVRIFIGLLVVVAS